MTATTRTERQPSPDAAKFAPLFEPFWLGGLELRNRIVMAPMTRCLSPNGVPGPDVADYYRRRAEGGVGLIITEGTWIPHPVASNEENAPRFYGDDALAGWKTVLENVHEAGGKIMPQLWHVGQIDKPKLSNLYDEEVQSAEPQIGPSGMIGNLGEMPVLRGKPATQQELDDVIEAFAKAAETAYRMGFDGVEIHGAHGYLIDQFFWTVTNLRTDKYGGSPRARGQFAADVIAAVRARTSKDFPVMLRISQWKGQNYDATIAASPEELSDLLAPSVEAGVTGFHCSQRRFWQGEFGTDCNLAGWTKKVTGKPTITVGSVGLDQEMLETFFNDGCSTVSLDSLIDLFNQGQFDLVALGRSLIANPDWPHIIQDGRLGDLKPYKSKMLQSLI